jgi:hypothetical protein
MNRWIITSPWVFYGVGGAVVIYTLYMMIRRPKGQRKDTASREPEL